MLGREVYLHERIPTLAVVAFHAPGRAHGARYMLRYMLVRVAHAT